MIHLAVFLSFFSLFFINGYSLSQAAEITDPPVSFVVTSIKNKTGDKKWSNQLIALGIRNLINEELMKTGCLIPVETDPEISMEIDKTIKNGWMLSGEKNKEDMHPIPPHKAEVHAVVKKMSKSRMNFFLGPFSSGKSTVTVVVELTLHLENGFETTAEGKGEGKTKTSGFIFQIRKDKIYFDESSIGRATHKAVKEAVKALQLECGA